MKILKEIQHDIIKSFDALNTIDEKYAHLFQLGDALPPMDSNLKTDENLVDGCQSKLWFHLSQKDGRFHLQADSDSQVIKGIAALLVQLAEGRTAEEILAIDLTFIDQLKIWKLPSERNNGLVAMLTHLHQAARLQNPGKLDKFNPV